VGIEMRRFQAHGPGALDLRPHLGFDFVDLRVPGKFFGRGIEESIGPDEAGNERARRHRSPAERLPLGGQRQMQARSASGCALAYTATSPNHGHGTITVAEVMSLLSKAVRLASFSECDIARSSALMMSSLESAG